VNLIDVFQLIHFRKGEAKVFQPDDKFEALKILVCINPFPSLDPPDRIEKANLFVVSDCTGAHADQIGQFADLIIF
jgi:hypothetical protein